MDRSIDNFLSCYENSRGYRESVDAGEQEMLSESGLHEVALGTQVFEIKPLSRNRNHMTLSYRGELRRWNGRIKLDDVGKMILAHQVTVETATEPRCDRRLPHIKIRRTMDSTCRTSRVDLAQNRLV